MGEGGGNYRIVNVNCGGRDSEPGGLFDYAKGATFENVDIVDPWVRRNGASRSFLKQEDEKDPLKLTGLDMGYNAAVSGALVGIAVNCKFTNIRVYVAADEMLNIENGSGPNAPRSRMNITDARISNNVTGGIVGLAIGEDGKATTFENCAASASVCTEFYWRPGECLYAGGLVGLAMGEVSINNSYAAGQIAGYYSGGLVGGTFNGNWKFFVWRDPVGGWIDEKGKATGGKLTVKNSFAAGRIERLTRVGAGLVAKIDGNKPQITGCYSAVEWQAIPPVAYGTFEGDTENFYLYTTAFDLPVTANILARFTCTGDALSVQNKEKSGIPCSAAMLSQKLNAGAAGKWKAATSASRWWWENNSLGDQEADYPFPMPAGNDEFWGDWCEAYENDTDAPLMKVSAFSETFGNYWCAYYHRASPIGRYVDTGTIRSNQVIAITSDRIGVNGSWIDENGLYENGKAYWANGAEDYGAGVEGATKITVLGGGQVGFTAATFYDPSYNPVKGYGYTPEGVNLGNSYLNWDYYGFYLLPEFGNGEKDAKYYVHFDDTVEEGKVRKGEAQHGTGDVNFLYYDIYVNEEEFKKVVGYKEIVLPASSPEILWNGTNFALE